MPRRPLNATAASLLGFLHDGPMSGWDLVVTAQAEIGDFWTLTQSQVYRELAAMEKSGLVEAGERGPRDRKPYTITEAGRAAFAEWVQREPGPETIRFPLLLTFEFSKHLSPERLATIVRRHRAIHAERLARYEQTQAAAMAGESTPDEGDMATLALGLAYERAVLTWLDHLPPSIGGTAEQAGGAGRDLDEHGA
jgi:DNA-binding PadR family transcriptional regulator